VLGLYLRGLVFDYRIGWESTFLGAPAVHALLSTALGPAAALLGIPFPGVDEIAAIRFPASAGGARAADWIHLHALTVLLAVILPRLGLFALAALRERRLSRHVPLALESPYFRRLLGPMLRGEARLRVVPYSYGVDEGATLGLRAVAQRLLGEGATLALAPVVGYGEEARAAEGLVPGDPQAPLTLALFSLAATPEPGTAADTGAAARLALVSHTNVGKTTLARTLLARATSARCATRRTSPSSPTPARPAGCARPGRRRDCRTLWDTPGFGDSVRLVRGCASPTTRSAGSCSEVWDRWRDRAFWCSQQALRACATAADVVLYLVNAAEEPAAAATSRPRWRCWRWVGKPVIVLLNQLGAPRERRTETRDVERWRVSTSHRTLLGARGLVRARCCRRWTRRALRALLGAGGPWARRRRAAEGCSRSASAASRRTRRARRDGDDGRAPRRSGSSRSPTG
jgi:hypothetical protein